MCTRATCRADVPMTVALGRHSAAPSQLPLTPKKVTEERERGLVGELVHAETVTSQRHQGALGF